MTAKTLVRWFLYGFLPSFAVWLVFVLTHDYLGADGHPARIVFIPVLMILLSPIAGINTLFQALGFTCIEDIHQDYIIGILNCALWGIIALIIGIILRATGLLTTKTSK